MNNTTNTKTTFSDALEGLYFELNINSLSWFGSKDENEITLSHATDTRIVKITIPRNDPEYNATIEITKLKGKHCRKGEYRTSLYHFTQCDDTIEGIELPRTIVRKAEQVFDAI